MCICDLYLGLSIFLTSLGDENAFLPTFPSRSATQTGSRKYLSPHIIPPLPVSQPYFPSLDSSSLAEDFSDETSSTHSPRGNPLSISIMDRVPDDTISSSPSSHSASPPSSPSPSPSPSPTPIPSSPKSPSRPHSPSPSRPHSPLPSPRRVARTTSPSPKASRRLSLRSHFSSSPVTTFSEEGDVVKKSIPHPEGGEKPGAILTVCLLFLSPLPLPPSPLKISLNPPNLSPLSPAFPSPSRSTIQEKKIKYILFHVKGSP